ncbi:hypothetical protein [Acidovorax sp. A1169]|uniref:hypothetical protein n=1 Tax=Acidovorax sp. A1169 TaxID=3059524 RepID=UPI002737CCD9|nr:hypothetical protein [Acidovorax sp. A1169]MDP4076825.1 hypothetical protein [Acidovorax sp. A1169]
MPRGPSHDFAGRACREQQQPLAHLLDTVLDGMVGIAFAVVVSTLDGRTHLTEHHEMALA